MNMQFRPWPQTLDQGSPVEIVQLFELALAVPEVSDGAREAQDFRATVLDQFHESDKNLLFEVIDIRRRASRDVPALMLSSLAGLLLETLPAVDARSPVRRLLFVGETESLDQWETESQNTRSIKKDVEFYVRALISAGAAEYAYLPDSEQLAAVRVTQYVRSAIIGLVRRQTAQVEKSSFERLIEQLQWDVKRLMDSACERPGFKRLGRDDEHSGRKRSDLRLLEEMNLLFQLGKRNDELSNAPSALLKRRRLSSSAASLTTFKMRLPDTSYELEGRLTSELARWSKAYRPKEADERNNRSRSRNLAGINFKLRRYALLRDLGRVIGSGAARYLRDLKFDDSGERNLHPELPRKRGLFVMDDELFSLLLNPASHRSPLVSNLRGVLGMLGWLKDTVVAKPDFAPGSDHAPILYLTSGEPCLDSSSTTPEHFVLVLIDPESATDYVGPIRIQKLDRYLKRRQAASRFEMQSDPNRSAAPKEPWRPPTLVFSRTESSGNVQQGLNLGASAYVLKNRIYHLLFDMRRALSARGTVHRLETETASQFRALRRLKPHLSEKLRHATGGSYIHGGLKSAAGGFVSDVRELAWIRELPKADLHCHMGTCIPYAAVETLARNTLGYVLESRAGRYMSAAGAPDAMARQLDRIARAVLMGKWWRAMTRDSGAEVPALVCLAAGAVAVSQVGSLTANAFGLGDEIVRNLMDPHGRYEEYEVAAMLVATIAVDSPDQAEENGFDARRAHDYFSSLAQHRADRAEPFGGKARSRRPTKHVLHDFDVDETGSRVNLEKALFDTNAALAHALERAKQQLMSISGRWDGSYTAEEIERSFSRHGGKRYWDEVAAGFEKRIANASGVVASHLADAVTSLCDEGSVLQWTASAKWLADSEFCDKKQLELEGLARTSKSKTDFGESLELSKYVCIPGARQPASSSRQSGLQQYLRGADLLGSAHLQYPDNILLAAYALTFDNASDNVIYSEVRCETTGYTRGGMGAQDATDLLRQGFDIASLFLARDEKLPLVRTNVLLAAKRHKNQRAARESIALMESYLDRRPGEADQQFARKEFGQCFPEWWRPCDVVGFDISGDESSQADWLKEALEPLAFRSSPITIHAGEAASAKSIWNAVYELNATRIGHGLRLAEDIGLLGYCVRQGVCMEMCPNSNRFTNGFEGDFGAARMRDQYPLKHYMRKGLEVCLATDNRYLHRKGNRTLSSEYITAAQLSDGLTRWEVLQIVKAGFKNAFLDKSEVKEMLTAIEERIYQTVARGWF